MGVRIRTRDRAPDRQLPTGSVTPFSAETGRGALFEQAVNLGPAALLDRAVRRGAREAEAAGASVVNLVAGVPVQDEPYISGEEANERYGIEGSLSFDGARVLESTAQELRRLKEAELTRQRIIQRSEVGALGSLGASFLGAAVDPIQTATAFLPATWLGRSALLAKGGAWSRFGARAAAGLAEGAVGAAVIEAAVLPLARAEQADYDLGDSLAAIFFSSALGGLLTPATGALGDLFDKQRPRDFSEVPDLSENEAALDALAQFSPTRDLELSRRTRGAIDQEAVIARTHALRDAVSAVSTGRRVDVGPVLRRAAAEAEARGPLSDEVAAFRDAPDAPEPERARPFAAARQDGTPAVTSDAPALAGRAQEIAEIREDIAAIDRELTEELDAGDVSREDLRQAELEVAEASGEDVRFAGSQTLDDDELTAAYEAAARCAAARL